MKERNVTVALTVACKVEGDAPVQDVGQTVAGHVELPQMPIVGPSGRTTVTPLRVELERALERTA